MNIDQVYLERLCKRLQGLLKVFNKRKPESAYFSKAETRALSNFSVKSPAGLLWFVRALHNQTRFIPEITTSDRSSSLYFVQTTATLAMLQLELVRHGEIKKLESVQSELRANNVMKMDRNRCIPWKDDIFDEMIVNFLKTGNGFDDYAYENIANLPGLYFKLLDYYLEHKKEISGTRQWYDFLAISQYMLYGIKIEVLQLGKLKNR